MSPQPPTNRGDSATGKHGAANSDPGQKPTGEARPPKPRKKRWHNHDQSPAYAKAYQEQAAIHAEKFHLLMMEGDPGYKERHEANCDAPPDGDPDEYFVQIKVWMFHLCGDGSRAAVLAHLLYRTEPGKAPVAHKDSQGYAWIWKGRVALARDIGLSEDTCRRALNWLIKRGIVRTMPDPAGLHVRLIRIDFKRLDKLRSGGRRPSSGRKPPRPSPAP